MVRTRGPFFYTDFNLPALLHLAQQIRNVYIPCLCDLSKQPLCGGLNWAITITFVDDVEWMFRSPLMNEFISNETVLELLDSEVATMRYVKLNSSIPVPDIFDYSSTTSNAIGIPYILMSKAPGIALSKFTWNIRTNPQPNRASHRKQPPSNLQREHKEKIMTQLGALRAQLSKMTFPKICSLYTEDKNKSSSYHIGKCLSPSLTWYMRDSLDEIPRGPFSCTQDFHNSELSALLGHVQELPLSPHVFFAPLPKAAEFDTWAEYVSAVDMWNDYVTVNGKIDHNNNRLDYCIAEHYLRLLIPSIDIPVSESCVPPDLAHEYQYPLHHPDLSASNIFVDEEFNISCVIDWGFASTVPIATLLATPSLPHPRDDIDDSLVPFFRSGFDSIFNHKVEEKSWIHAQRSWYFSRLVNLDELQDFHYFSKLYTSVYSNKPKDLIDIPTLFRDTRGKEEFRDLAKTLVMDDRPVDKVARDERDYFPALRLTGREAVARKLTLMSEFNKGFVADKRLWSWLGEALVDF
ncbi:RNase H domain containing protein [Sclerotinia borealis F-4128]|uniref:RNase H domain containing protein n=1 Tax=Sclerotinia borealis (strain F-4128) TaxID=1432307 RepID=W9CG07_SCLBF|nr:RNase H domain containing protein [Sclerotinia borealis F-4128]